MGNIAIVYLTLNHADTVRDVLEKSAVYYKEKDIDVYYFDSSEDVNTLNVINEYRTAGFDNIYHIKISPDAAFDEKLMYVFTDKYKLLGKYNYIWPMKDRMCVTGKLCDEVIGETNSNNSIIHLGITYRNLYPDFIRENTYIYKDKREFYMNWGWQCASLGVTLFRWKDLERMAWEDFASQTHWNRNNAFTHYMVIFYLLDRNEKGYISVIGGKYYYEGFFESEKSTSLWNKDRFEIWIRKWHDANFFLPHIYDVYKEYVTKSNTALSGIIGNQTDLIMFAQNKEFSMEELTEYADIWDRTVDVSLQDAKMIMTGEYSELAKNVIQRITEDIDKGMMIEAYTEYNKNKWIGCHPSFCDIYEGIGKCIEALMRSSGTI